MYDRLIPLVVGLSVFAVGCGDDDAAEGGATVDDVAALAQELDEIEQGCTLEYEGLVDDQREASICTLGDEIAELSIWSDDAAFDQAVEAVDGTDDPLVVGPNWTIDVHSPDLAERVADATGGSVRS